MPDLDDEKSGSLIFSGPVEYVHDFKPWPVLIGSWVTRYKTVDGKLVQVRPIRTVEDAK